MIKPCSLKLISKIISMGICLFFCICYILFPSVALSADSERKTVRLGYVLKNGFYTGLPGQHKDGLGYEYAQRIAYYTGWRYEYVYGSFSELLEKLKRGEIDVMGNLTRREDRLPYMFFSDYPGGKDSFYIYTLPSRADLTDGDVQALNNAKIGVTVNSHQSELLAEWAQQRGLDIQVVYYPGGLELQDDLKNGVIDAMAYTDLLYTSGVTPIASLGFAEYYFGINKERPDLLLDINAALKEMQTSNPYFNDIIYMKHMGKNLAYTYLDKREKQWLEAHNNVIRLGYLVGAMPYSDKDSSNNSMIGVLQALCQSMTNEFGVVIEPVAFSNQKDLLAALKNNTIDAAGPMYSDYYLAEQEDVINTDVFSQTTLMLVHRGDNVNPEADNVLFAESATGIIPSAAVKALYPRANILEYISRNDALIAVASGKATTMLVPTSTLNSLRRNSVMESLNITELPGLHGVSICVDQGNRELATIFNKGIVNAHDILMGVAYVENSRTVKEFSLREYIGRNAANITLFLVISIWVLLLVFVLYTRQQNQHKKALEQAMYQARRASQAKSIFLFNMSHDIRTPMNAIVGFGELLEKNADDPDKVRLYTSKLRDSSKYLMALINNVLEMSRIESGEVKLEETACDIREFNKVMGNVFEEMIKCKNLEFVLNMKVEHFVVMADEVKLRQIFLNLLSNAVKYTPAGGRIYASVREFPANRPGYVVLESVIEDTGIGISEEFLPRLFDNFTRERNSTESKIMGTGLGLAITKRLVELMGGTIKVESAKGKGTRFIISLTHKIADIQSTEKKTNNLVSEDNIRDTLSGIRVLLAEDNDINAEIMEYIMEEANIKLDRVSDGAKCYKQLDDMSAGYYSMIVMDIQMPVMDGYETSRCIRAMEDTEKANIPIIAMTANAFQEDKQRAADAGMNDYLSKPINVEELFRVMAKYVRP